MEFKKPHHLLIPVDSSEASRAGLRVADDLARRFGASLTVLRVEAATAGLAEVLASSGELADREKAAARHLEKVRADVQRFADETLGDHPHAVVVIEGLFIAESIVQFAVEREIDWICMSASGHRGWRRLVLGSVTEEVVRRSPLPVLTVRGRTEEASQFVFDDFRRVLVALDLGDGSEALVATGAGLAAPHGELTLLHVIEIPPEYGLYGVPLSLPAENLEAAKEWTEGALDRLTKHVPEATLAPFRVLAGRPAERILEMEHELEPDVTVIGTHGRHGLDHLMLGSVAERVMRRASGPVLVLPTGPRAPAVG